jgi:hypothetical protein
MLCSQYGYVGCLISLKNELSAIGVVFLEAYIGTLWHPPTLNSYELRMLVQSLLDAPSEVPGKGDSEKRLWGLCGHQTEQEINNRSTIRGIDV